MQTYLLNLTVESLTLKKYIYPFVTVTVPSAIFIYNLKFLSYIYNLIEQSNPQLQKRKIFHLLQLLYHA